MKLKKVLSVVLASIMVLGLAACGNKESADSEKEGGQGGGQGQRPEDHGNPWRDDGHL